MKRGEIYYIAPSPAVTGSEQVGGRPGIIVSNDIGNKHSAVVEVVYTTTQIKRPLPTHVEITSTPRKSLALCEQIITVAKQRVGEYVGKLSEKEMELVNRALAISLGLTGKEKRSMQELIKIGNHKIQGKEFKGKRVVTFKDIDLVHERPDGTARKRFNDNKKHFIFGVDYFVRNSDEAKNEFDIIAPNGLILITEPGYLMLVKSFTDDLAWKVQRELVNNYFNKVEPLSQIEILKQSVEVLNRHDQEIRNIDSRMDKLEYDIPLYGSEADELSNHVKRKGVAVLGGKDAPAYKNPDIRPKVYRDICDQMKREFGIYDDAGKPRSYKALKRKYIQDAHGMVDGYEPPKYLREMIQNENVEDQG